MRCLLSVSLLLAMLPVAPAQAASCWNREDIFAAKVRDLDTLLTEVSRRCVAAGLSAQADYDMYRAANRGAISATNQRLKARFWTVFGAEKAGARLDSFHDALASQYATVPAVQENCGQVSALAREAAATGGSVPGLVAVADRNNLTPPLPGGACRAAALAVAAR
ncbi:hypothetical protein SAMN06295912_1522 [Sphingomonas laterariae]|uniref:Lysozyme inhibitor LprI N-terminal domain-containing protein n=1 Tax=Edaphosphingomonas laterariae TaxID=861865 RepID=A0A239KI17_9SPHN|nr:hypothetical protein [Sphingomonas laterariae]SNT17249.1 hypothetical protein SAMN06295912_1522 [Sphingomonas laterariae]